MAVAETDSYVGPAETDSCVRAADLSTETDSSVMDAYLGTVEAQFVGGG